MSKSTRIIAALKVAPQAQAASLTTIRAPKDSAASVKVKVKSRTQSVQKISLLPPLPRPPIRTQHQTLIPIPILAVTTHVSHGVKRVAATRSGRAKRMRTS